MGRLGSYADVVVVGGGFVGLATAAALSAVGARVTVLEGLATPSASFRGELVHPRGVNALRELDLEEPILRAGAEAIHGFSVFRNRVFEERAVDLPYRTLETGRALDHGALVACMRREVAERRRIRFVAGARAERLVEQGGRVVGVRTSNADEHRGALFVMADGRHSRMRRLLGVEATSHLVSFTLTMTVTANLLPQPRHGNVFVGGPGPVLAYPCADGRARICIDIPHTVRLAGAALASRLRNEYAPFLPVPLGAAMVRAVETSGPSGCANHEVNVRTFAARGAALVGDAGGCVHPITAAGMTTGLNDAALLAACVAKHGVNDDALSLYQRRRRGFVRARAAFTHSLYLVLRGQGAGAAAMQDGLFDYWQRSARARTASMAVLSGDEERVSRFVAEYARVLATSSRLALRTPRPTAALRRLLALASTAQDGMGATMRGGIS